MLQCTGLLTALCLSAAHRLSNPGASPDAQSLLTPGCCTHSARTTHLQGGKRVLGKLDVEHGTLSHTCCMFASGLEGNAKFVALSITSNYGSQVNNFCSLSLSELPGPYIHPFKGWIWNRAFLAGQRAV